MDESELSRTERRQETYGSSWDNQLSEILREQLLFMDYNSIFVWSIVQNSLIYKRQDFWEDKLQYVEGDINLWLEKGYTQYVKAWINLSNPTYDEIYEIRKTAIEKGYVKIFDFLLHYRPIRHNMRYRYYELISLASKVGQVEILQILLDYSSTRKLPLSPTSIFAASFNNQPETLKLLLKDKRFDPTYRNNWTIVHSSEKGHVEIVKILLEDGRADPNDLSGVRHPTYAIIEAIEYNHPEIVKLLLEDGRADPTVKDNLAIEIASRRGYTEIVKLLLEDGRVDPNLPYLDIDIIAFALIEAVENNHPDIVKLLLEDPRVDPTIEDNLAIETARNKGYTEIVELLVDAIEKWNQ